MFLTEFNQLYLIYPNFGFIFNRIKTQYINSLTQQKFKSLILKKIDFSTFVHHCWLVLLANNNSSMLNYCMEPAATVETSLYISANYVNTSLKEILKHTLYPFWVCFNYENNKTQKQPFGNYQNDLLKF